MTFDEQIVASEKHLIGLTGVNVVYRRGEYTCQWQAMLGTTMFQMTNSTGTLVAFESADFIGVADDLVLNEEPTQGPITPERGDRLWVVKNGNTFVYEVLSQPGMEPYRYSDPGREIIRVHTKLIDEV